MASTDPFEYNPLPGFSLPDLSADKAASVQSASALKLQRLAAFRESSARPTAQPSSAGTSWVEGLGLNPESVGGQAVNLAASFGSGASRLLGNVLAIASGGSSAAVEQGMTPEEIAAYNRYQQFGSLSGPETMAVLNRKKAFYSENDLPEEKARKQAEADVYGKTVLEQFQGAQKNRETANKINDFFDISSIVQQDNRQKLSTDLGEGFQQKWGKVTKGWDDAKKGEFINGSSGIVSGFADLVMQAGSAAVDNPKAVAEYAVENLPQLFVGGLGKAGAMTMTAGNIGYALDNYQKGIFEYQKNHDQQLPSLEEQRSMAMWAASLALAEQVGDKIGLGAAKLGAHSAEDVAKTGFKQALLNSIKAGGEGLVSEAATEGYQTYAEGVVTQKPASAQDIFTGAVIGGVSGATLSGGGRVTSETTKTTPEHAAAKELEAQQKVDFQQAVANNDPSAYFDQSNKAYDPSIGLGVLFAHNQKADVAPEVKQQNFTQALDVAEQLQADYDALVAQRKGADKKTAADLAPRISELQRQIKASDTIIQQMDEQLFPTPAQDEIKSTVQEIASADPEIAAPAAERVLNLAMTNTEALSIQDAQALASDNNNSLTSDQRNFLRSFSAAREQENILSSMGKVSQEVLYGSKQNIGIQQYQQRIGSAIAANRPEIAQRQLGLLTAFAADHAGKAQAAAAALSSQGLGAQIVKTEGGWQVATQKYSDKEIRKNGGLTLNSARLVRDIQAESKALTAAKDALTNAVALRFPDAGVQSVPSAAVVPAKVTSATDSPTTSPAQSAPSTPEIKQGTPEKELTDQRVKDLPHPEAKAPGE
ncbi:MAG TPA: hypothetical protein VM783_09215, partial [Candidatus Acidoferrum sp.]|nr:hypothetical protein [Candidatus Acidoferrum sp.]